MSKPSSAVIPGRWRQPTGSLTRALALLAEASAIAEASDARRILRQAGEARAQLAPGRR